MSSNHPNNKNYKDQQQQQQQQQQRPPAKIVIVGGGIVGLVLALALQKHIGITVEIYEKAHTYQDDVGAALGMYPNGMRVLRDINPLLLQAIREQGYPYLYRRWERHDGTEIAEAKESVLTNGDDELSSIGIRRWRLQKVLHEFVKKAGIPIYFQKGTADIVELEDENGLIQVTFEDGTSRLTELVFACDGGRSKVRQLVANPNIQLNYTGITCLMGISNYPSQRRGINFPSSTTTNCHSVYFPTGENEQCFQVHWPLQEEDANQVNWGNLDNTVGQLECHRLATRLRNDGWNEERYCKPLEHVTHAVKVGFALLEPRLQQWVYGKQQGGGRIVLVGDAAHPPVPYVGQGAQMGVEDAGTIALLLKELCLTGPNHTFAYTNYRRAMRLYEQLRIPRTSKILDCSKQLGAIQDSRTNEATAREQELLLQGEVMMDDTLSIMLPGAMFNYQEDVRYEIINDSQENKKKTKEPEKEDPYEQELQNLLQQGEDLFNEHEGPTKTPTIIATR